MKLRTIFLSALLLVLAGFAMAESITFNTSAAQDARLTRHRTRLNKATCLAAGRAEGCSQAQARQVNPDAHIYSSNSDMLDRLVTKGFTDSLKNVDTSDDQQQAQAAWVLANDAGKNAICQAVGLPNGCEIWPR